jgi:hypothetical protein
MIGNNQMALRELYSSVLDNHPGGWVTSFMSGMPGAIESIVSGYDAVIFELGAADGPERVPAVKALRQTGTTVITHVEGRQAPQQAEELRKLGLYVVESPVSGVHIEHVLDQLVQARRDGTAGPKRARFGERLRGLFGGS